MDAYIIGNKTKMPTGIGQAILARFHFMYNIKVICFEPARFYRHLYITFLPILLCCVGSFWQLLCLDHFQGCWASRIGSEGVGIFFFSFFCFRFSFGLSWPFFCCSLLPLSFFPLSPISVSPWWGRPHGLNNYITVIFCPCQDVWGKYFCAPFLWSCPFHMKRRFPVSSSSSVAYVLHIFHTVHFYSFRFSSYIYQNYPAHRLKSRHGFLT